MLTRAAVAWAAGKPPTIEVEGPKAGEMPAGDRASGIGRTDLCARSGAGATSPPPGGRVIPLYTPECRRYAAGRVTTLSGSGARARDLLCNRED
jgi:Zn-dependent alcohol dehydrogenase